jgi:hypothetical protein
MSPRGFVLCLAAMMALVTWFAPGAARGNSFVLDLSTDPTLGVFQNVLDASNNPGVIWTSAPIAFDPIVVDQGDIITLKVTLTGGQSLELQSGAFFSGNEEISFTLLPLAPGTTLSASSTLTALSGVAGNLDATLPITTNFTTIGQIGGTAVADMTQTAFQFNDFQMETTLTSLTGGPVTLSSASVIAAASAVTLVPEPASAFLVAGGLMLLGSRRTRRSPRRSQVS